MNNENMLQKHREREKLKRAFEQAEQREQRLGNRRACNTKRRERSTIENDREGILRKRVYSRAKIKNEHHKRKREDCKTWK